MFLIMKILISLLLINVILFAQKVELGIDVLEKENFKTLLNKNVGLITNPTGVNNKLKSTIDILYNAPGVKLKALYGPEHGVRGDFDAGVKVDTYKDEITGLPVYSLYGKTRKPTKEMLEGIDVLVYDIQDIGCRSYTFISTMGLAMEAAAENNIEFVVLDRPNPLGGLKIEGNIVEDGYISFVSQFKIPYVHSLTVGELAILLNEEGMLNGKKCKLTVIKMKRWDRKYTWEDTGLEWILTSPHIPYKETAAHYVTTGILGELGIISEGVGYTIPFQVLAAEWIDAQLISTMLNSKNIPGVVFRPITFKPFYRSQAGKNLHGVQVHITDYEKVNLMSIQFYFLEVHHELYPEKNPFLLADKSRLEMFDKVCGSNKVRELFSKNMKYADIEKFLNKDVEDFRKKSSRYLLY